MFGQILWGGSKILWGGAPSFFALLPRFLCFDFVSNHYHRYYDLFVSPLFLPILFHVSLVISFLVFFLLFFFFFGERERERERERFFGMLPRFLEVFASPPRSVPGRNSANQFQEKEPLSGGGGILRDARGSLTQTDGDSITRDRCEETETDASGFSQIGSRCSKDRDS